MPAKLGLLRRISAAEMKYMRRTAGYIWTDYKTNAQIAEDLKITPILDKLLEYKRSWIQHANRMPRNWLHRAMKHYSPAGRKESRQTFEETSGYVRPERVNKWPNSMKDLWWWWWWWIWHTRYVNICDDLKMPGVYWCYHVIDAFIDLCVVLNLFWQLLKISKTWIRNFSEQCEVCVNNFWFIIYFILHSSHIKFFTTPRTSWAPLPVPLRSAPSKNQKLTHTIP